MKRKIIFWIVALFVVLVTFFGIEKFGELLNNPSENRVDSGENKMTTSSEGINQEITNCNHVWNDQDLSVDFFKEMTGSLDCKTLEVFHTGGNTFQKFENHEPRQGDYLRDKNGFYVCRANSGDGRYDHIRITTDTGSQIASIDGVIYLKDTKGNIYFGSKKLEGADPATLKVLLIKKIDPSTLQLPAVILADKDSVWLDGILLLGAHSSSFKVVSLLQDNGFDELVAIDDEKCYNQVSTRYEEVVSRFQRVESSEIPGCAPEGLKQVGTGFLSDGVSVFAKINGFKYNKIQVTHPEAFQSPVNQGLIDCYREGRWYQDALDGESYQSGSIDCERATFYDTVNKKFVVVSQSNFFSKGYVSDDSGTYYAPNQKSCGGAPCEFMKISSDKTIKISEIGGILFANDSKNIFYNGGTLSGISMDEVRILSNSGGGVVFTDNKQVWFEGSALEGTDSQTFTIVPNVSADEYYILAKDKNACYHLLVYGGESGTIPGCNPNDFRDLGKNYSTDGKSVFYQNTEVQGANPETFKVPE